MLFYLTDSLIVEETSPKYKDIRKAVRNIAIATCESKHYIMGDVAAIEHFVEVFKGAKDEVAMLFDHLKQTSSTQVLPDFISYYIEIVACDVEPNISTKEERSVAQVPYVDFLDTCSVQATVLIGEDIEYDCCFYRYILEWYKGRRHLNINSNFTDGHGAGARMEKVLESCCKNKETSLCLVDSDKKFPEQQVDGRSTCKKCMSIRLGVRNKVVVIDVQEIENLLPLNFIDHLRFESEHAKRKEQFDKMRGKANWEEVLRFLDLKEGLKKYPEYKNNTDFIAFARKVCSLNPEVMKGLPFQDYYDSKNDNEVLYPGLMRRLLKFTIEFIKQNSSVSPELLDYQEREWVKIGQTMLDFGFARNNEGISN